MAKPTKPTINAKCMQPEHLYQELERLRAENAFLKRQPGVSEVGAVYDSAAITMQSSTAEKISLFRMLFRGRDDVYAKRWYSEKLGRGGYAPACSNEWREGICNKSRWKCKDCPHRVLTPLSDAALYMHLSGKDLLGRDDIGIYPLLEDDTTYLHAIDFDKDGRIENVASLLPCALRSACRLWRNAPVQEMAHTHGYFLKIALLRIKRKSWEPAC